MRALSSSDRKILESNPYISKITDTQIIFSEEFKKMALAQAAKGVRRSDIFNGNLGVKCFDKKFMDSCLSRWRKKQEVFGTLEDSRGSKATGRPRSTKNMSYEEIEAENAYLRKVVAHLKKAKGLADDEL